MHGVPESETRAMDLFFLSLLMIVGVIDSLLWSLYDSIGVVMS